MLAHRGQRDGRRLGEQRLVGVAAGRALAVDAQTDAISDDDHPLEPRTGGDDLVEQRQQAVVDHHHAVAGVARDVRDLVGVQA